MCHMWNYQKSFTKKIPEKNNENFFKRIIHLLFLEKDVLKKMIQDRKYILW